MAHHPMRVIARTEAARGFRAASTSVWRQLLDGEGAVLGDELAGDEDHALRVLQRGRWLFGLRFYDSRCLRHPLLHLYICRGASRNWLEGHAGRMSAASENLVAISSEADARHVYPVAG